MSGLGVASVDRLFSSTRKNVTEKTMNVVRVEVL